MGRDHHFGMFPVPVAAPPDAPMGPMVRKVFTSEWILGAVTQSKPQCRTCCGREETRVQKRNRTKEIGQKRYKGITRERERVHKALQTFLMFLFNKKFINLKELLFILATQISDDTIYMV